MLPTTMPVVLSGEGGEVTADHGRRDAEIPVGDHEPLGREGSHRHRDVALPVRAIGQKHALCARSDAVGIAGPDRRVNDCRARDRRARRRRMLLLLLQPVPSAMTAAHRPIRRIGEWCHARKILCCDSHMCSTPFIRMAYTWRRCLSLRRAAEAYCDNRGDRRHWSVQHGHATSGGAD